MNWYLVIVSYKKLGASRAAKHYQECAGLAEAEIIASDVKAGRWRAPGHNWKDAAIHRVEIAGCNTLETTVID